MCPPPGTVRGEAVGAPPAPQAVHPQDAQRRCVSRRRRQEEVVQLHQPRRSGPVPAHARGGLPHPHVLARPDSRPHDAPVHVLPHQLRPRPQRGRHAHHRLFPSRARPARALIRHRVRQLPRHQVHPRRLLLLRPPSRRRAQQRLHSALNKRRPRPPSQVPRLRHRVSRGDADAHRRGAEQHAARSRVPLGSARVRAEPVRARRVGRKAAFQAAVQGRRARGRVRGGRGVQ